MQQLHASNTLYGDKSECIFGPLVHAYLVPCPMHIWSPAPRISGPLAHLGFHCDQHENAADFFLDVISQCEHSTLTTGVAAATFGKHLHGGYNLIHIV